MLPKNADILITQDSYLSPFRHSIEQRISRFHKSLEMIEKAGGIDQFTLGYKRMGFNETANNMTYREWAPNAKRAYLIGDFNSWNRSSHPMVRDEYGVWSIELPPNTIPHNTKVKISMEIEGWADRAERIPAYIKYAVQDVSLSPVFDGVYWSPSTPFVFKNPKPPKPTRLKIYESHVGISSPELKVTSYRTFTKTVLPRIAYLGYNTIQLMAILEHPYYASFGYQVTSFYAPTSRCGTPEDLKDLIDTAHGLGITVLLDIVHSHSSKNILDGLNQFDGTDHLYFHEGERGSHPLWDSRLFNYSHPEVLRFLLSNLRYWTDEFGFDGFRFDGVTSMLYHHHGLGTGFGGYDDYFGSAVDQDSVNYLMLANYILKTIHPDLITIAEDVSGMPTLCRPVSEGGIGFEYRLSMAIPDMWIKLLKEKSDDEWNMGMIVHTLTNRRDKASICW
jgi:1,4-alpha-glucan branching enzyme